MQQEQQSNQQQQEPAFQWTEAPRPMLVCQICGERRKRLSFHKLTESHQTLLCESCWKQVQVYHDEQMWKRTPVLVRLLFQTGFLLSCALVTFALSTISFSILLMLALLCVSLALLLELSTHA